MNYKPLVGYWLENVTESPKKEEWYLRYIC